MLVFTYHLHQNLKNPYATKHFNLVGASRFL